MRSEEESSGRQDLTIALVGDCLISRPLTVRAQSDPRISAVRGILQQASAAIGNLETSIVDLRTQQHARRRSDEWIVAAPPAVAADLANLGISVVGRANNHALDWGAKGMRETTRHLDEAGIAHAGVGEHLGQARLPAYYETPYGRVGLVSIGTPEIGNHDAAGAEFGGMPGRPGINPLRVSREISLPRRSMTELHAISRLLEPWSIQDVTGETLTLLGQRFVAGSTTAIDRVIDTTDLTSSIRAIRLGRQHADVLVVSLHVHEEEPDRDGPPAFVTEYAHAAIDAGADIVFGHGVHHLWPIEVYREKPIFYGLGNFILSPIQEYVHEGMYRHALGADPQALDELPTDADVMTILNDRYFDDERYFHSVVAEVALRPSDPAVTLYPVDLGYGRSHTESGLPRIADPAIARRTLSLLQAMSTTQFNTELDLDKAIGRITLHSRS